MGPPNMSQPGTEVIARGSRLLVRPRDRQATLERRWKTRWTAELRGSHAHIACIVVDMSVNGAGLNIANPPTVGSVVTLILMECKPISARVAWGRSGAAGLHFLERQPWVVNLIPASANA